MPLANNPGWYTLSIVVPCYNEEASLPLFYDRLSAVTGDLPEARLELILVDDGSADGTLAAARALRERDPRVRVLAFSRNFGKEAAMLAGMAAASGDLIAVMDADLQDPPSLLPEMIRAVREEGWDCAAARRVSRKGEPPIRSFFARRFYRLINKLSRTEIADGARDFRVMTRQVVEAILSLPEVNRFSKGIFSWVGFRTKWVEYENVARVAGETKWSFWRLFLYSLDGIVAFSTLPLSIASVAGLVFCLASFVMILVIIVKTLIWGDPVGGWPSLVCILFFISGIQLFCMGILGQYLSKTYLEAKRRPLYILREDSGKPESSKEKE